MQKTKEENKMRKNERRNYINSIDYNNNRNANIGGRNSNSSNKWRVI